MRGVVGGGVCGDVESNGCLYQDGFKRGAWTGVSKGKRPMIKKPGGEV